MFSTTGPFVRITWTNTKSLRFNRWLTWRHPLNIVIRFEWRVAKTKSAYFFTAVSRSMSGLFNARCQTKATLVTRSWWLFSLRAICFNETRAPVFQQCPLSLIDGHVWRSFGHLVWSERVFRVEMLCKSRSGVALMTWLAPRRHT